MTFSPIAIVGRACVLPGALTPEELWDAVANGRDLVGAAPEGRWGIAPERILTGDPAASADRTWSDRGGYVSGFDDVFDPEGFALAADDIRTLDPLFQLALHTGRAALQDAGWDGDGSRVAAVLGNLSFPSASMSRFAEQAWLGELAGGAPVDPRNRFMSGLPAHLLAHALGLGAGAFALDAACASSLYAIKLACDKLHDGDADLVVAGAVNRADDLFIHVGFCALEAMSRTGRSRPFHAGADGLVPAEGAGFVVLKRLEDVRPGETVHGVIRGVGLSNDGRGRGLLAPSEEGQVRALRAAYAQAGISPADVQLVECHATGTPVGDATEIRSMAEVFDGAADLPIGSLKSNMGHLITAAGVAGLIKVLEAMKHGVRPPSLHADDPNPALAGTPFRVLTAPEPWRADGPRRAAVSAFGFGGNNAHLIVEEYRETTAAARPAPAVDLAVVGLGARVADGRSAEDFAGALLTGTTRVGPDGARADTVDVALRGLRFPPRDLEQALAQQTLLLGAAREACDGRDLPRDRTSVIVGMGADPEVARYGARWRLAEYADADDAWLAAARDAIVPVLRSAGVLGTMPNIPANRLNSQLDVAGPSFTVSSEELSGIRGLEIAARALRAGEIDAAVVAAVDLSCEPVHRAAADAVLEPSRRVPGDAAVVLVVKRLDDARRDGDPILAVLPAQADATPGLVLGLDDGATALTPLFGHPHAASGLLHVAAGVQAIRYRALPSTDGPRPPRPWSGERHVEVRVSGLAGQRASIRLSDPSDDPAAPALEGAPVDPETLVSHLATPREAAGPRLSLPAHPAAPEVAPPGIQHMPTAPALVPIGERHERATPPRPASGTQPPAPILARDGATVLARDGATVLARDAAHAQPVRPAAPSAQPAPPTARTVPPDAVAPPPPRPPSRTAPTGAPMPTPTGDDPWSRLAAYHQQLSQVHQEFLAQQSAVHRQFLEMRQSALSALLQGPSAPTDTTRLAVSAPAPTRHEIAPQTARELTPTPAREAAPTPAAAPASERAPTASPAAAKPKKAAPPVRIRHLDPDPAPRASSNPTSAAYTPPPYAPTGRTWDRQDLEVHAAGRISTIFGPEFERQDGFEVQVRMPEPPLLLADRVTGIDARPGVLGTGTVWTETDVRADSWWLNDGYMPAGILIESGQADLFLISYMGVDFLNRGERAYRLLGCELTYHGSLPRVGETLQYDIHVDGHANQGDVRLFFFHYDCRAGDRPVLTVRGGQAGFFTEQELADSAGVLWSPEEQEIVADGRVDPPAVRCTRTRLDGEQLRALSEGDAFGCFGPGFEFAQTHNRTPKIQAGDMLFLHRVTDLDPAGGPWKRGYLRGERDISPDDWFFPGHFKNDPCMPGTLMFEGCLQAMAIYLASLGYTLRNDGWRFEPVPEETYKLLCRGQVLPTSKKLVYEIFVEEVWDGPIPTLYADLLCTVDGLKAFHARRMGLRLVPDWPLTSMPELLRDFEEPKPVAKVDGFEFGYPSLLACAWGRPSEAFGPMYDVFDGTRRVARLPGPPYHFMSRVTRTDGELGACRAGAVIEIEYDVPSADEWYFRENGTAEMPFCVFLEAALQPCGWLASYIGSARTTDKDLMFRNLDGTGTVLAEVPPDGGTFRTVVKVTNVSQSGGMIIESFDVGCFVDRPNGETVQVYDLKTVFGFFPPEAFENQVGLPITPPHKALFEADSGFRVDLTERPARYCASAPKLPGPMLLMLDRVVHFDPEGGTAGLGALRAEKDVDPSEWFFKAHFFQDPVQPGSLGIEAMIQLLQFWMIETDQARGIANPRFEPIANDRPMTWKYRGQVVPKNERITTTLEVVEVGDDERGRYAVADASLWVDGKRIYEAKGLAIRVVPGSPPDEERLDPEVDTWVGDHRPTWTLPALPMMSMVDRLLAAAPDATGLAEVQVHRWVTVEGPTRLRTEVDGDDVRLFVWREARDPRLSRFELAASARLLRDDAPAPAPLPPVDGAPVDPYADGTLFHGPAFHHLVSLVRGPDGASGVLRARAGVPLGHTNQGLLDGATHTLPHDQLWRWADVPEDRVAYPYRIDAIRLFGPAPQDGEVRCEARFEGLEDRFPRFRLQLAVDDRVWAEITLTEILLPKGPIGSAAPADRVAFLRDRRYAAGVGLSREVDGAARLSLADVKGSDWLPGTVHSVYGTDDPEAIAAKDLVARQARVHPSRVSSDGVAADRPLTRHPVQVTREGDELVARSGGEPVLDISPVKRFWREWFDMGPWPVEDLYYGLIERFVGTVHLADPEAYEAQRGRSLLYLANHQVGVESLIFSIVASALNGVSTVTLAKIEHQTTWLGRLIQHCFAYPGVVDPKVITYFDRTDKSSLPRIIGELAAEMAGPGKSVMVHVEGTRSLECRTPVQKMSGAFVDMALQVGAPIVPVRFTGALPVEPMTERIEFPIGMGRQDLWIGRPILPDELRSMTYKDRKDHVIDAINGLGPANAEEQPLPGDAAFAARVDDWVRQTGATHEHATLWRVLEELDAPVPAITALREAAATGRFTPGDGPVGAWTAELARRLFGERGPKIG